MNNCVDCFNNCGDKYTTDRCVKYTGVDIPILGICNGDSLYQLEVIILEKLTELANQEEVILSDITIDCAFVQNILNGEDQTVANLLQTLITASCTLRELIQDIQDELDTPFTVLAPCLTLPTDPTRDDILSAVVTKLCSVSTDVATIKADYVKASELCAAVTVCLAGSGTVQEYTKMPKYVAMPYMGSLSVFDGTGKGLSAFGYDKVYICNGNNGTQDLRGRALVGANTNVVGPALDAAVDPALVPNAGYAFTQNTKKGTYTDTLTVAQLAAHGHAITDPGHSHTYTATFDAAHPGGSTSTDPRTNVTTNTGTSVTNITINSAGNNQPHNTTQPSFGVVWIVYLP